MIDSKRTKLVSILVILIISLVGCGGDKECTKKSDQEENTFGKPVIYLYPTTEQRTSVKVNFKGKLTTTYPDYKEGWNVIANPKGDLINLEDNREYSYLFWEGKAENVEWDLSKGYVVEGKNTKNFLQSKLSELGLTPKEYNEFIVYWLPKMENNKYNLITFQDKVYKDSAELNIDPKPDSILRVYMVFKDLDKPIALEEPKTEQFLRNGFTVVEWGGTEIGK